MPRYSRCCVNVKLNTFCSITTYAAIPQAIPAGSGRYPSRNETANTVRAMQRISMTTAGSAHPNTAAEIPGPDGHPSSGYASAPMPASIRPMSGVVRTTNTPAKAIRVQASGRSGARSAADSTGHGPLRLGVEIGALLERHLRRAERTQLAGERRDVAQPGSEG